MLDRGARVGGGGGGGREGAETAARRRAAAGSVSPGPSETREESDARSSVGAGTRRRAKRTRRARGSRAHVGDASRARGGGRLLRCGAAAGRQPARRATAGQSRRRAAPGNSTAAGQPSDSPPPRPSCEQRRPSPPPPPHRLRRASARSIAQRSAARVLLRRAREGEKATQRRISQRARRRPALVPQPAEALACALSRALHRAACSCCPLGVGTAAVARVLAGAAVLTRAPAFASYHQQDHRNGFPSQQCVTRADRDSGGSMLTLRPADVLHNNHFRKVSIARSEQRTPEAQGGETADGQR
jgi:hypothetical protein